MISTSPDLLHAVKLSDLNVVFGETRALDDVSLQIIPGEVHGLVGQNGSGKSTLVKVLSGYHVPQPGALLQIGDQWVKFPITRAVLRRYGIAFVHQDLGLIPQLSVLENLLIGELSSDKRRWISWPHERERARVTFEKFGLRLDPTARVDTLSGAQRAMLAIVRAVEEITSHRSEDWGAMGGLLVLDEPTAFLPEKDKEHLFQLMQDVAAAGESVLFVSHYLEEVLEITDQVTVLRDGKVVGDLRSRGLTTGGLVELIIGRPLDEGGVAAPAAASGKVGIQVSGLAGGLVRGVDLHILEGEIVGLTGLLGSGFEDVPNLIFGARKAEGGSALLGGVLYDLATMGPERAIRAGIALIPADRQNDGLTQSLSVVENITLELLAAHRGRYGLSRSRMLQTAERLMEDFDVRPRDPRRKISELSGGNQQKVLLAKWFASKPRVLLLHEPTQGVDVGSRQDILRKIQRSVISDGLSVLCVSADPDQLAELCDRVVVMGRGRVSSEILRSELTKDRIVERCYRAATVSA